MGAVIVVLALLWLATAAIAWLALDRLDRLQDMHADLQEEFEETVLGATDLIVAVSPLIEQTDWMTGRWGGKFEELVALEKQRNEHVVTARQALNTIPFVKEATMQAIPAISMLATDYEGRNNL